MENIQRQTIVDFVALANCESFPIQLLSINTIDSFSAMEFLWKFLHSALARSAYYLAREVLIF